MTRQRDAVWIILYWAGATSGLQEDINCFSVIDESKWDLIIDHDASTSSLSVSVSDSGPTAVSCLEEQKDVSYRVSVLGDADSEMFIHPWIHIWEGKASTLVSDPPVFNYLTYGGRYRVEFARCESIVCDQLVYSEYINIQSELKPWCEPGNISNQSIQSEVFPPAVSGLTGVFRFSFSPCSEVQSYDYANLSLYESTTREDCGGTPMLIETRRVEKNLDGSANITYKSPEVEGDHYYCVSISLSHISCQLSSVSRPSVCSLQSDPVWIQSRPLIAAVFPFCRSHLECVWLYIVLTGTFILLISVVLAVVCVRCCDRRTRTKHTIRHDEVDFSGEVINLTAAIPERRTWSELHTEWEEGGERTRGKILLLYSPDTKLFKELQESLKSFLDLACHCDIYDLFDDALFDAIALDPAEWLEKFVDDRDVKIIVISSIGAYRRQMALQGQMPLNLPENSLLDGLFTSGLRFISTYPGLANSGRVATARYEMLHLTEQAHSLLPPVGGDLNREFLIPTQLHEVFCWVHHLQPLDLMGKPWVNYHLELQLLQDALKLVRRDRTLLGTCPGVGNGLTMV